ncbi:MAG: type II toxin-antitoxin system RelE/ParE family toxin [Thermodesulfovibrionales bacterium]|nr:type II toxin-antitoxin system RelE/ParE family toxin [Thermodesulfovibrionales bacterium]
MKQPKYAVRLLQIAEDDLNEIVSYIAAENLTAAEAVAAKIEKNLLHLSDHPFIGRVPEEDELTGLGYRYLIVQNYLIFYTIEGQTILIHRMIHGARDYLRLL